MHCNTQRRFLVSRYETIYRNLYLSAYLRFVSIHKGPRSRRISMQNVEINQKVRLVKSLDNRKFITELSRLGSDVSPG